MAVKTHSSVPLWCYKCCEMRIRLDNGQSDRRVSHPLPRKRMLLPSLSRECGGDREEEQQSSTMANSTVSEEYEKAIPEGRFVVVDVIIPLASAIDDVSRRVGGGQCRGGYLWCLRLSTLCPTCIVGVFLLYFSLRFRTPLFWSSRCSSRCSCAAFPSGVNKTVAQLTWKVQPR